MSQPQRISEEDYKELDTCIDKMAESFIDFVHKLKELKINPNVEWIQTIHTVLDSGACGVSQLAFFDGDRAYSSWKTKRLEVCKDEEVEFEIHRERGDEKVKGTFNLASGYVQLPDDFEQTDDITGIDFEFEGETHNVCLECLEGTINKSSACSFCD